jgi:hypothetical protein
MLRKRRSTTHSPRRRIQNSRVHKKVLGRQRAFALAEMYSINDIEIDSVNDLQD